MKKKYFSLILAVLMISCTAKNKIDYQKVSLIEMTIDSFSGIFPDAFLYTGNNKATVINVSKIKNSKVEYEDSYTYDPVYGFLTSTRLYSDGDYYVTEYTFDKSKLTAEISYIDYPEKEILRAYSYEYTKGKDPSIEVRNTDNKIICSYKINSSKNEIIIQKINNSNELDSEYIYQYENSRLVSITEKYPSVKTILKTDIYYLGDKIIRTELYSESRGHDLLSKKEYQYDNDERLIELIQTDHINTDFVEIFKTVFKEHDAHGNWTVYEDNKAVYKRDIIYSE